MWCLKSKIGCFLLFLRMKCGSLRPIINNKLILKTNFDQFVISNEKSSYFILMYKCLSSWLLETDILDSGFYFPWEYSWVLLLN